MGKQTKYKALFCIYISILFLVFFNDNSSSKIKVCLCSPVKKENPYLNEYVDFYKSYQVDKIFLYDNNDIDGEHLEEVIDNYIRVNYVEVINFRGMQKALYLMMNDCYNKNYLKYDWLIFYEIDEYIHLKEFKNIKNFLIQDKFNKCETIQLNWVMHTDNNQIYYKDKPLKIRFPYVQKNMSIAAIKSILKGKISNITINCVHKLNFNLKTCDGFGNRTKVEGAGTDKLDNEYFYIDHYFCKSTEEFVNKINKGDVLYNKDNILDRLKVYFAINKITKEKIDYIKKNLCVNISFDNILNN